MSSVATRENDRDAHHVPRKCFPGTIKTWSNTWFGMSLETRVAARGRGVNELHDSLRRTGGN